MIVFKFGGASIKNAQNIEKVATIVKANTSPCVVVISAMGKTTNAMEALLAAYIDGDQKQIEFCFDGIYKAYELVAHDLFNDSSVFEQKMEPIFNQLKIRLQEVPSLNYDYEYDQIVPYGELLSTTLVSAYLNQVGCNNQWVDIRPLLRTDDLYRNANVDWEITKEQMQSTFTFNSTSIYLTQGFIGSNLSNQTVTLGREGSDFSAAIVASCLNAESVTIWKDVAGVLNADPRYFEATKKIPLLSYREAIELAYFGASVIHPKTLKPLHLAAIPLYVKCYDAPQEEGTKIESVEKALSLPPIFILKQDQTLLTLTSKDLDFISENEISTWYSILSEFHVTVNLVQQSALYFSFSVDTPERDLAVIVDRFSEICDVKYNTGLSLLTVRFPDGTQNYPILDDKTIYIQQQSRNTERILYR